MDIQPRQKLSAKYETWRRRDRQYDIPWIQIKRYVFESQGLKFAHYQPGITPIEEKLGLK